MCKKNKMWTEEEKAYIRKIHKGKKCNEIIDLMEKKFNETYKINQIKGILARENLKTDVDTRFKKGHIPWHKKEKVFKEKTKRKCNQAAIGAEIITKQGYISIKAEQPNVWELKHRYIYKKYKGEIPPGYLVIFADKNNRNFDIDNLILVSRKQAVILNRLNLINDNAELTKVGINVANLILKIGERKNE